MRMCEFRGDPGEEKKKTGKKKKDEKKKETDKMKDMKKKEVEREDVYVDINDILEVAKTVIMERYGGISFSEIVYAGDVDKLKFTIPNRNREGKCNEILPPDEEGGCGTTGGSCVCGEDEGHEGNHKCELCGEEW